MNRKDEVVHQTSGLLFFGVVFNQFNGGRISDLADSVSELLR